MTQEYRVHKGDPVTVVLPNGTTTVPGHIQTVASVATELIAGKTVDEALSLSGQELSAPLGALPPMKIHCAQLVENALRSALIQDEAMEPLRKEPAPAPARVLGLLEQFQAPQEQRKVKIVLNH